MRTFAQKPKATQSIAPAMLDRVQFGKSREVSSILRLPRTTGNQAVQQLQQAGPAGLEQTPVPPVVHEVLRQPGQPLDPATRAFMESRFGHDFSRVRVYTDAQAAESAHALDALAYTVGQNVVFSAGHFSPQSMAGRALIAHELTHTIQQETASSHTANEIPALEQEANQTVLDILTERPQRIGSLAAVPNVQFLKVTSGGFGRALEEFTNQWSVPDSTILLLRTSATFMRLARTLDQNFVAREDSFRFNPEIDSSGRIMSGDPGMPRSMIGKRELMVIRDDPAFLPVQSPDNPLSADLIQVNQLDAPGLIQELGHEVTHAANFVGASAPSAQTLVAEINAGVQEEISTRQSEATILAEVRDPQVRQQVAQVGSRVQSEVERDIAPAIGMTYLESFFFERRLRDARVNDQITEDKAREIREVISMAVRNDLAYPTCMVNTDGFGLIDKLFKRNGPSSTGQTVQVTPATMQQKSNCCRIMPDASLADRCRTRG